MAPGAPAGHSTHPAGCLSRRCVGWVRLPAAVQLAQLRLAVVDKPGQLPT
jgi:hypothetical protein